MIGYSPRYVTICKIWVIIYPNRYYQLNIFEATATITYGAIRKWISSSIVGNNFSAWIYKSLQVAVETFCKTRGYWRIWLRLLSSGGKFYICIICYPQHLLYMGSHCSGTTSMFTIILLERQKILLDIFERFFVFYRKSFVTETIV